MTTNKPGLQMHKANLLDLSDSSNEIAVGIQSNVKFCALKQNSTQNDGRAVTSILSASPCTENMSQTSSFTASQSNSLENENSLSNTHRNMSTPELLKRSLILLDTTLKEYWVRLKANSGTITSGLQNTPQESWQSNQLKDDLKYALSNMLSQRSMLCLQLGDTRGALLAADESLSIRSSSEAYFRKGCALYCMEEFYDSIAAFNQCLEIDPTFHYAAEGSRTALARLGCRKDRRPFSLALLPKDNDISSDWKRQHAAARGPGYSPNKSPSPTLLSGSDSPGFHGSDSNAESMIGTNDEIADKKPSHDQAAGDRREEKTSVN